MTPSRTALPALLVFSFLAAALAPALPPLHAAEPAPRPAAPVGGVAAPAPVAASTIQSGGQPTEAQIKAAGAAGYRTVINLRPASEPGFEWEPAAAQAAGMAYISIPVAGEAGLTRENVTRLDDALRSASAKGPVMLHCGSGNRAGAMLALRAAWIEGKDPSAALDYGRASGLTSLEPAVRKLIGLPVPAVPPAAVPAPQ